MSNSLYVLSTTDKFKYHFYPFSSDDNHYGRVQFRVQAAHNVHIVLSNQAAAKGNPLYEIVIGGWDNTQSVIRKNRTTVTEALTPDILSGSEKRGFVIEWNSGSITVSPERTRASQEQVPFLTWDISEPLPIKYVGVSTGWGASGEWTIQPDQNKADIPSGVLENWVQVSNGEVPPGAFAGGRDQGEKMYVVRASFQDGLIPGKLVRSQEKAYIPWNGVGMPFQEYEVLCDFAGEWLANSKGNIPPNALNAGQLENGTETLYVGKVAHEDDVIIGKFQPTHEGLYVVHKGKEEKFSDFEVLCRK